MVNEIHGNDSANHGSCGTVNRCRKLSTHAAADKDNHCHDGKRWLDITRTAKEKLAQQIPIFEIRLFGSRARGDDTPESDVDVYIETVTLTREQRRLVSDILWEVGFENGVVVAPVIFSRDDLENGPLSVSPLFRAIKREGIPV